MTSTFGFLMVLYSIFIGISMAEIFSAVAPLPDIHGIQISLLYGLIGFFALTYRESIGG